MSFICRGCVLATILTLVAARGALALQYTVTNIGGLGAHGSMGWAINESGQVGGESYCPKGPPRAFGTDTSGIINPATDDQGTLGGIASYGRAINDSGQTAGYSYSVSNTIMHAFRTDPGAAMVDLGTLGGLFSDAYGINNSGQVVGYSSFANSFLTTCAFRTAPNAPINPATDALGTLGGANSLANAINNAGQVVGYSDPISGPAHAFRTTPGGVIDASADLGQLASGFMSNAAGINDAGDAVGTGYLTSDLTVCHAFYVPAGRAILPSDDLGMLPDGMQSGAFGINNANVIVGTCLLSSGLHNSHAVIWYSPNAAPVDLNTLIPADSNWVLREAHSINDAGQITGWGYYNGDTSQYAGFVLNIATPEPAALSLLLAATPLLLLRRRRGG